MQWWLETLRGRERVVTPRRTSTRTNASSRQSI